jgi:hypothetical protein
MTSQHSDHRYLLTCYLPKIVYFIKDWLLD